MVPSTCCPLLMTFSERCVDLFDAKRGTGYFTNKNFFAYVETQFDAKIKAICSDNGYKFTSHACQIYLAKKEYCIKGHGVVERKHRHLIKVAGALLIHVGLPQKFWGESVLICYSSHKQVSFYVAELEKSL